MEVTFFKNITLGDAEENIKLEMQEEYLSQKQTKWERKNTFV